MTRSEGSRRADDIGSDESPEWLTTREVAAYLRLKERKVYGLAEKGEIPCTRRTGRWLFPRSGVEAWLREGMHMAHLATGSAPPPLVFAGSHDPLVEWCLAEAETGLARLQAGSLDGLERLARNEAMVAGCHLTDPVTGGDNVAELRRHLGALDVVAIEWSRRQQGLVVAPGNPLGIAGVADLKRRNVRVAGREEGSGSHALLARLLTEAGIARWEIGFLEQPARSEMDVGIAVLEGEADAGLALEAVARMLRLDFVPLCRERYDLVMRRRSYFEKPIQALLRFARSEAAAAKAKALGGYDLAGLGDVRYNAP